MGLEIISTKEIKKYINDDTILIIDLRSRAEYNSYHLPKAKNMPYLCLEDEDKIKKNMCFFKRYNKVLVYCDRGNKSLQVTRKMSALGVDTIDLCGGIEAYKYDYFRK